MKKIYFIIINILLLTTLISCSKIERYQYIEGKINIVATTTMIGDLAEQVGGENVSITTLMNVGVDPHSYVPRPSVTQAINKADLVIVNGLFLEAKMGKVLEMIDEDKLLVIGDHIPQETLLEDETGAVDPHIWFELANWIIATNVLKDKLISLDIDNEQYYLTRANNYLNELNDLEEEILTKIEELPKEKRILVTAHDAFSYFGKAYGFYVHSIQGISTETEASVKDIQNLANLIVNLNVKAIFIESSLPDATIKSVINAAKAQGHIVSIGGTLYSDSLGDKESNANTYINMFRHNVIKIVEGMK